MFLRILVLSITAFSVLALTGCAGTESSTDKANTTIATIVQTSPTTKSDTMTTSTTVVPDKPAPTTTTVASEPAPTTTTATVPDDSTSSTPSTTIAPDAHLYDMVMPPGTPFTIPLGYRAYMYDSWDEGAAGMVGVEYKETEPVALKEFIDNWITTQPEPFYVDAVGWDNFEPNWYVSWNNDSLDITLTPCPDHSDPEQQILTSVCLDISW